MHQLTSIITSNSRILIKKFLLTPLVLFLKCIKDISVELNLDFKMIIAIFSQVYLLM